MAIKTWFTQPEGSFASYYYYNETTRDMVRIRLELGRKEEHGYPMVIMMQKRYIGFGTGEQFDIIFDENGYSTDNWNIAVGGTLYYQKGSTLYNFTDVPTAGLEIVDFSQGEDVVHFGNKVTDSPRLPVCNSVDPAIVVNETMLKKIAEKYVGDDGVLKICEPNADECTLAKAVKDMSE